MISPSDRRALAHLIEMPHTRSPVVIERYIAELEREIERMGYEIVPKAQRDS